MAFVQDTMDVVERAGTWGGFFCVAAQGQDGIANVVW